MSGSCSITILRTIGLARATKEWIFADRVQQWACRGYAAGKRFTPEERAVSSLSELAALLKEISRDPTAFVVRGALRDDVRERLAVNPKHSIVRRKLQKNDGSDPTLAEVARFWLMIDVDKLPLPPWADLATDPDAVIAYAVEELLPETFQDADCFWQLSSSAGFKTDVLKAHLWFWLAEPATSEHIKAVLEQHAPGVDRAPFNAAQPQAWFKSG
jgi:putative DNA primase/helicase